MTVVEFHAPAFPAAAVVENVMRQEAEHTASRRNVGYRDGFEHGMADAQREVDAALADHRASAERLTALADALERAVHDLGHRDAVQLESVEGELMAIAVTLAEQLVGRELSVTAHPVVDAMRRALQLVPERGAPVVRVHPDDEHTAREAAEADLVLWTNAVTIVPDGRIERGGCIVDVGACRVDAQLGPAIARLREMVGIPRDAVSGGPVDA